MKKKAKSMTWTVALTAVLTLAAALPCAAQTTWIVGSTADDGTLGTLRYALEHAADGDTIDFEVSGTIALTGGELVVSNSVTITGPGQDQLTVDGQQASRVFNIPGAMVKRTVTISGLTIANGATDGGGGGVFNGAELTLSDCTLRDNYARAGGGGVFMSSPGVGYRGPLTITRCTLSGNRAGYSEGSTCYGGGAVAGVYIAGWLNALTIEDSLLTNNIAPYGGGIVIDVDGDSAGSWDDVSVTVTVTNSTLTGNSASQDFQATGGAMEIHVSGESYYPSSAWVTVENCTLTGNSAGNDSGIAMGGAIANMIDDSCLGGLTLKNSTLSDNSAVATSGYGMGGAVASLDLYGYATVAMENCTLSGNSASDSGGAILHAGGTMGTDTGLTLTDCTFADNSAVNAGGAICNGVPWLTIADATATLTRCKLTGNSVTADYPDVELLGFVPGGGAIYNGCPVRSATLAIADSTLSGNTAQVGGAILTAAIGDEDGGDLYPAATSVSIVRSTLSGNSAVSTNEVAGGGAIVQVGLISYTNCSLALDNSTLAGNWVSAVTGENSNYVQGGAIMNGGGQVTLNNCTLSGNADTLGASGIGNADGTVDLKNTILANDPSGANLVNFGTITSYGYNLSSDDGGAFLTAAGDLINTNPQLGPLANNGGPTWTCALLAGSPAVDAGSSTDSAGNTVATDQRGVARPQGDGYDIGAFEGQTVIPPVLTVGTATVARKGRTITVSVPITNTGTAVANNVAVIAASLDSGTLTSSLPSIKSIRAGATKSVTLKFSASSTATGQQTFTLSGTSSLGAFSTTQEVTVP